MSDELSTRAADHVALSHATITDNLRDGIVSPVVVMTTSMLTAELKVSASKVSLPAFEAHYRFATRIMGGSTQ